MRFCQRFLQGFYQEHLSGFLQEFFHGFAHWFVPKFLYSFLSVFFRDFSDFSRDSFIDPSQFFFRGFLLKLLRDAIKQFLRNSSCIPSLIPPGDFFYCRMVEENVFLKPTYWYPRVLSLIFLRFPLEIPLKINIGIILRILYGNLSGIFPKFWIFSSKRGEYF